MLRYWSLVAVLGMGGLALALAGCNSAPGPTTAAKGTDKSSDHAHLPTAHGTAGGPTKSKTGDAEDGAAIQAERAKLSPEERKLVDAQEWCVTSKERLGSMGAPIKLTIKDQPVFICCGSCQRKALADPDATLATVKELKAKKQAESSAK
jgi:hypothetical protein